MDPRPAARSRLRRSQRHVVRADGRWSQEEEILSFWMMSCRAAPCPAASPIWHKPCFILFRRNMPAG